MSKRKIAEPEVPSNKRHKAQDPTLSLAEPATIDDEDGHYIVRLGENFTPRYKILSQIGSGTFGKVVECWDREEKKRVAIKIIRNVPKYRDAAMIEIKILKDLHDRDPQADNHCVQLLRWFDYRQHVAMVFEKLGWSLYDFLRKNNYRPFSIEVVQQIAYQLIQSVTFLHDLTLIHTDLKPENILLNNSDYTYDNAKKRIPVSSEVSVIDFGSATYDSHYHTNVVSTRHYRAPEIILGLGWSFPCDMWSIGCILIELYTGDALFQTHDNHEHLAMMEQILGHIPPSMICHADHHAQKYFYGGKLDWPTKATSASSIRYVRKLRNLKEVVAEEHNDFFDLLVRLLEYDPDKRVTASECMKHPFIQNCPKNFRRSRSESSSSAQSDR